MGLEAICRARVGQSSYDGKALLETDELIFRGEVRVAIPLASVRSVTVSDGEVLVEHAEGSLALELGARVERWAEKIRSPRTLIDKLDVKKESIVSVVELADADFIAALRARSETVTLGRPTSSSDIVFLGVDSSGDLPRIEQVAATMRSDSALWVIHPKGVAGVKDTDIFAVARNVGRVPTKVARFSATHTAEKLVVPRSHR